MLEGPLGHVNKPGCTSGGSEFKSVVLHFLFLGWESDVRVVVELVVWVVVVVPP